MEVRGDAVSFDKRIFANSAEMWIRDNDPNHNRSTKPGIHPVPSILDQKKYFPR